MQRRRPRHAGPATEVIVHPHATLLGKLSTEALHLHLCSAAAAADTDLPGFVPDDFLALIEDDITLALIELDVTGLWLRHHDGYQIPPRELSRVIATLQDMLHDL